MNEKFKHSLKCTVAFVSALTILTSAVLITGFAENKNDEEKVTDKETVAKQVDDYTSLFPGITSPKMKLSDPEFTEKDWYEYIEYEFYTEVKDGDMTYRIYQPTDYSSASIMAITDYNPKEVLGGTSNITMNLGELQGVLDIASQGGNISKEYVGLDLATGLASKMKSINDVMDNSKYYSSSSFLGIPGDKKFTGVTNDGFFNADSLEIEITEAETVSACKTVAIDSSYSVSENAASAKTFNTHKEASDTVGNSHEESNYIEDSNTSGLAITDVKGNSSEVHSNLSAMLGWDIVDTLTTTIGATEGVKTAFEESIGVEAAYIKSSQEGYLEAHQEISNSVSVGASGSITNDIGTSNVVSSEHSVSNNLEKTNTTGKSSSDVSSIEHSITSGNDSGVSYEHANEMSVNMGYGVDYQYGNDHSLSVGVKRIFNARDDKEVKNVGWKLCEYVVKIPYYIEAVKTDSTGEEKILYGQYVNYNLLNGISRVFANGYIEHWYTGELVTYADFFDGFITATELVDMAKEQQAAKVPKGSD